MDCLDNFKAFLKRDFERFRKHGDPIFVSLAATNQKLVACEVNILNPQAQAFHQPQPRAVHQRGCQPSVTCKIGQHRLDFLAGHDHRQSPRLSGTDNITQVADLSADNMPVEEQ